MTGVQTCALPILKEKVHRTLSMAYDSEEVFDEWSLNTHTGTRQDAFTCISRTGKTEE